MIVVVVSLMICRAEECRARVKRFSKSVIDLWIVHGFYYIHCLGRFFSRSMWHKDKLGLKTEKDIRSLGVLLCEIFGVAS